MKKLIALLTACTAMTCLFASCGKDEDKDDDDKKASKKNSTSVSESADEDEKDGKDDKDADEEETTEEETEEEEETTKEEEDESSEEDDDTDEKKSEKKDDKKKDDKKKDSGSASAGGSITQAEFSGMWISHDEDYDGLYLGFDFNDNGSGDLIMDFSELMRFDANGGLIFGGEAVDSDMVSFDGSKFSFAMEGTSFLEMTRTGASDASTMDGEYVLNGGMLYDELLPELEKEFGTEDNTVYMIVAGETLYMSFEDLFKYELNGDTLTVNGSVAIFGNEEDSEDIPVEYDGTTLTLTSGADVLHFTKVK